MRIAPILVALVVTTVTLLAVETAVDMFRAKSVGNGVLVEWRSTGESDLSHYEVERAGDDQVFRFVANVPLKGSNQSYSYTDDEAFGKGDNPKISSTYFTYRLKLVHSDQTSTYSTSYGVSHNVSSIKRTWGMIKEMFR